MSKTFNRWEIDPSELHNMTPAKARDLIIKCFHEAQKETIARGKRELDLDTSEEEIEKSVRMTVRMAFEEVEGSYDNPTPESLGMVIEVLARKAGAWRTPPDIIEHHKKTIAKVLQAL